MKISPDCVIQFKRYSLVTDEQIDRKTVTITERQIHKRTDVRAFIKIRKYEFIFTSLINLELVLTMWP